VKTILISFLLLFGPWLNPQPNYSITIKINAIKNNKGKILISLYNSTAGFPTDITKAVRLIKINAQSPAVEVILHDLGRGTYAVAVMHDENNNGKMDKNFLNIPKEGYCVSNNAKGFLSAPSFSDAKFDLEGNITQNLKMIY
jgi:uncharacterized protein (DUF2141 family)